MSIDWSMKDRVKAHLVGVTGGVASGKSTVARLFQMRGVPVFDADAEARELTVSGGRGLAALVDALGEEILDERGDLDRSSMRRRLFVDATLRRKVENILHPMVRDRLFMKASEVDAPYVVMVIPLLVETGGDKAMDTVVVVDCPTAIQRERLIERDGTEPDLAKRMISSQTGRPERLHAADRVIDNSGDLASLEEQVEALHRELSRGAGSGS